MSSKYEMYKERIVSADVFLVTTYNHLFSQAENTRWSAQVHRDTLLPANQMELERGRSIQVRCNGVGSFLSFISRLRGGW